MIQDAGRPVFWPLMDEEFDLGAFRVRFIERSVHSGHSTFDFVLSSSQASLCNANDKISNYSL